MGKINKSIGINIRKFRKQAGLTQEKLAELVNVDFTTINKIENGKRNPALTTLVKIASKLKIPLKDLL